ncbi:iron complex transport system ATP-binding protein [Oceanospirillum multiglobuliferum]|nr:ABC transporter ATP-binding protein [Oceanospirillum multiglobuliferum]SJZ86240.1 iron complex transport system ATP-binding protein [Oceanospirillum multiglobuliferum]
MMNCLTAKQLKISISGKTICQQFDLQLNAGEVWGILGGNGAGKTTLLHTLAGFRAADQGEIRLFDQAIAQLKPRTRAQQMGFLLQDDQAQFPATVLETVLQGRHPHLGFWQWESPEDYLLAEQALLKVGLADYAHRPIEQLSGGERQRLKIATLLVQQPKVWLLDEPANHLDLHHQIELLSLLTAQIKVVQGCLLMSLHDLNLAQRFCDKLILLYPDQPPEQGCVADLLVEEKLSQLYQHPIRCLETDAGRVFIAG